MNENSLVFMELTGHKGDSDFGVTLQMVSESIEGVDIAD